MNMHTLKVTLKQHTPLLHFQHEQEGATLRASEVKPKLDKYIIKHSFHDNFEECKEFLVGYNPDPDKKEDSIKKLRSKWEKGFRALNYKMRIEAKRPSTREEYLIASYVKRKDKEDAESCGINIISNTPYFAQEKQNADLFHAENSLKDEIWNEFEKKGIIEKDDDILTITWFVDCKPELWTYEVQSFFLANNFGTRQSKGFGSYEATKLELDGTNIPPKQTEELLKRDFQFVYKKTAKNSLDKIFETINRDYKLIKSGQRADNNNPYLKSKLMLYLPKETGWDKKFIKEAFSNGNFGDYKLKVEPENSNTQHRICDQYVFVRALLGLAENFEFLLENPPHGNKNNKLIVKISNSDIRRYKSPLLFKVIGNVVYLVGNDIDTRMFDKKFRFSGTIQGDNRYKDIPLGEIDTPKTFSLVDFIRFAMSDNENLNYTKLK